MLEVKVNKIRKHDEKEEIILALFDMSKLPKFKRMTESCIEYIGIKKMKRKLFWLVSTCPNCPIF